MKALQAAKAFAASVGQAQSFRKARALFGPPVGGAGYYSGQAYRYQQTLEGYRNWSFIAIAAWIREIAGGEEPQIGRIQHDAEGPTAADRFAEGGWEEERRAKQKAWRAKRWIKKALGGPGPGHEFEAYDHRDPMVKVFRNPNGPDVAYDLWAYLTLFKKLCGYVVLWVLRDGRYGIPREIWPIPTHWIQRLVPDGEGQPWFWQVNSPWGQSIQVPFEETVQLQDHSPLNRWEGYAVSIAIAEWLDTYESLVRSRLANWKNGAVPNIHVALGDTYSDPDEAFLHRFYAKWFTRFQGENNTGLPLITGPDIEVKAIGQVPVEMYQQGDDLIRDNTLAAFGVPKGIIGLEPTSSTSAYAPLAVFARYSINPELTYIGQVLTEKVIKRTKGYEDGVLFWNDRVPNDPAQVNADIQVDQANGSITPNEQRALRGRESYPHGGDDPVIDLRTLVAWQTGATPTPDQVLDLELESQLTGANGGAKPNGALADTTKPERPNGALTPPTPQTARLASLGMNEGSGAAGGYLVPQEQRRNRLARIAAKNGKVLTNGKH